MYRHKHPGGIVATGVAILAALAACGPPSSLVAKTGATPALETRQQASPAPTPSPAPSKTATPAPTASKTSSAADLLAKGKLVFDVTAGGVGCASCHGLDGGGGSSAPYVRGATQAQIRNALSGGVPAMSGFIVLTDEEVEAVAAYLAELAKSKGTEDHDHEHH